MTLKVTDKQFGRLS